MAEYTVRVELIDAQASDYELLHQKMQAKGYLREITGDNGERYQLPPSEYVARKELDVTGVRDEVRTIANTVKNNRVLVTKSDGQAWYLDAI
ncbi:hypothetical protein [Klebsiella variicola]|uniref:hypothetical protein n=1 Tax=Klebsiella variicola TaxID=244366 RepID=UPI002B059420|nr:hypothetical protein [Klebsiella variicola]